MHHGALDFRVSFFIICNKLDKAYHTPYPWPLSGSWVKSFARLHITSWGRTSSFDVHCCPFMGLGCCLLFLTRHENWLQIIFAGVPRSHYLSRVNWMIYSPVIQTYTHRHFTYAESYMACPAPNSNQKCIRVHLAMAPLQSFLGPCADPLQGIGKLWDTLASMGSNFVRKARLEIIGLFIAGGLHVKQPSAAGPLVRVDVPNYQQIKERKTTFIFDSRLSKKAS